jgi:hypothetical protein
MESMPALDEQSLAWDKDREILVRTMERTEVLVAHTEIQVEFADDLPGILKVKIEGVYPDKSFWISHRGRGR